MIAVEDDGPGVPDELREMIFEPFRQGPDAPQHSPGVGVGLTLVRRFAELQGGRAWVQEREGGGASFRVFLPTTGPEQVQPPDRRRAGRARPAAPADLPGASDPLRQAPALKAEVGDVDDTGGRSVEPDDDLPHVGEVEAVEPLEREA